MGFIESELAGSGGVEHQNKLLDLHKYVPTNEETGDGLCISIKNYNIEGGMSSHIF